MSDPKPAKKTAEPKSFGWMAEFEDENKLLEACRAVRDAGYTRTDAFSPFPIHGIDEALGIKPAAMESILPEYLWRFRPSGQYDAIKESARNLRT